MNLAEVARVLAGSLAGTLGFAMLLHAPRRSWLPASVTGMLTYLVYWLLHQWGLAEAAAILASTLLGTLIGLMLARRLHMIGTIFLTLAIVPIVPGLGLYRTMRLLGEGYTGAGAEVGVSAMMAIACIALGIALGSMLDRLTHPRRGDATKVQKVQ